MYIGLSFEYAWTYFNRTQQTYSISGPHNADDIFKDQGSQSSMTTKNLVNSIPPEPIKEFAQKLM